MVIRNTRHEGFAMLDDAELDVVAGGWGPSALSAAMQVDSSFAAGAQSHASAGITEALYAEAAPVVTELSSDFSNAYAGIVEGLGVGFGPDDAAMLADSAQTLDESDDCRDDDDCSDDDDDCDRDD